MRLTIVWNFRRIFSLPSWSERDLRGSLGPLYRPRPRPLIGQCWRRAWRDMSFQRSLSESQLSFCFIVTREQRRATETEKHTFHKTFFYYIYGHTTENTALKAINILSRSRHSDLSHFRTTDSILPAHPQHQHSSSRCSTCFANSTRISHNVDKTFV